MVRYVVALVVGVGIFSAIMIYFGYMPGSLDRMRSKAETVPVEQLGGDLYPAAAFPSLDPDGFKPKPSPITLHGFAQIKDKQEVPSLVSGQMLYVGDPVPDGDVGEVVVTTFNADYPMIRLATGDLSAVLPGTSPCGRTNMRIKGWMGRADQTAKVKGMFVQPGQIAEIAKRHPELERLRLVVTRAGEQDVMTLMAESATPAASLVEALAATLQAVTKLRGEIKIVPPGSLPNDGKVIADQREIG